MQVAVKRLKPIDVVSFVAFVHFTFQFPRHYSPKNQTNMGIGRCPMPCVHDLKNFTYRMSWEKHAFRLYFFSAWRSNPLVRIAEKQIRHRDEREGIESRIPEQDRGQVHI